MGWHPETPGLAGAPRPRRCLADGAALDHPEQLGRPLGGVGGGELSRTRSSRRSKRKETYGTSGTRIDRAVLRRLELRHQACARRTSCPPGTRWACRWAATCRLRAGRSSAPRFIVAAWKDDFIGTEPGADPDRQGLGGRERARRRRRSTGWQATRVIHAARGRHRQADLPRPRPAGSSVSASVWEDPGLQCERARVLLRARAREAGVPLQHSTGAASGSGSIRWT